MRFHHIKKQNEQYQIQQFETSMNILNILSEIIAVFNLICTWFLAWGMVLQKDNEE